MLALIANAMVVADTDSGQGLTPPTRAVLDRLAGMAVRQQDSVTWQSSAGTFMGGHGQTGDIETTALAALALQRAGSHPDLSNQALIALVPSRRSGREGRTPARPHSSLSR